MQIPFSIRNQWGEAAQLLLFLALPPVELLSSSCYFSSTVTFSLSSISVHWMYTGACIGRNVLKTHSHKCLLHPILWSLPKAASLLHCVCETVWLSDLICQWAMCWSSFARMPTYNEQLDVHIICEGHVWAGADPQSFNERSLYGMFST